MLFNFHKGLDSTVLSDIINNIWSDSIISIYLSVDIIFDNRK